MSQPRTPEGDEVLALLLPYVTTEDPAAEVRRAHEEPEKTLTRLCEEVLPSVFGKVLTMEIALDDARKRTVDQAVELIAARALSPETAELYGERLKQDEKWGANRIQADETWLRICVEELGEASKAIQDKDEGQMRHEVIQAAAVLVAWLEDQRRHTQAGRAISGLVR